MRSTQTQTEMERAAELQAQSELAPQAEELKARQAELQNDVEEAVERQQALADDIADLEQQVTEKERQTHELSAEQEALEQLIQLLEQFKGGLSDSLQPMDENHRRLASTFEKAGAQMEAVAEAMKDGIEALQPSRTELTESLSELQQHLNEPAKSQLTEVTTNAESVYSALCNASQQEQQKLDADYKSQQAAFAELIAAVATSHGRVERSQEIYQQAFQQLGQQLTEWGGEVTACHSRAETHLGQAGQMLTDDLLTRLDRDLSGLDGFVHQEIWGDLSRGYNDLRGGAEHSLSAFGGEVLSTGSELGNSISEIINHVVSHAQSEVRRQIEDTIRDIFDDGVEMITDEIKEQLTEAVAGLAMTGALSGLAPSITSARAALEALKVAEGVVDTISP